MRIVYNCPHKYLSLIDGGVDGARADWRRCVCIAEGGVSSLSGAASSQWIPIIKRILWHLSADIQTRPRNRELLLAMADRRKNRQHGAVVKPFFHCASLGIVGGTFISRRRPATLCASWDNSSLRRGKLCFIRARHTRRALLRQSMAANERNIRQPLSSRCLVPARPLNHSHQLITPHSNREKEKPTLVT